MKLKNFAWILFIYTLLVILWGAWVRISHSGDGCGASWPVCHGQVIPEIQQTKTLVEYSHRLTSGLFGFLVLGLFFWVRKKFPKGSSQRLLASVTLVLTITEALLGAKLVLLRLVGQNDSFFRLFAMTLHQLNSFLLTGFVFLSAYFISFPQLQFKGWKAYRLAGLFLLIGMSGAIAALAGTLFPTQSLWEGIVNDFSPDSHMFLRLRILHPALALSLSALFVYLFVNQDSNPEAQKAKHQTIVAFVIMVAFGGLTLINLSPLWMKVTHLALAHLLWSQLLRQLTLSSR